VGNNLTVTAATSFKTPFAGAKQVWMYAAGSALTSGWQQLGSWTATAPPTGVLSVSNATVGQNLETSVTVTCTPPAPTGGLSITLTSSDSTKLVVGSQLTAGVSPVTVKLPEGATALTLYVQALASSGNVTLTATAAGYTSGVGTINLTPSAFVLSGPSGISVPSFSTSVGLTTTVGVVAARLTTSNQYAETQLIRGGLNNVVVSLSSSAPAVGKVSPIAVTFSAGDSSLFATFSALSIGSTTITAAAPAGFTLPASGLNTLLAGVGAVSMTAPNGTIGKGLEIPAQVSLSGVPSSDRTLTLTSGDSNRLRFAAAPTDTGTGALTITMKAGFDKSPEFYIQGFDNSGMVTYTAAMTGFGTSTATITLAPAGIVIAGPSGLGIGFTTTTGAPATTLTLYSAMLDISGNFVATQAIAGGVPVTFNVISSNTGAGTIGLSPVTLAGGSSGVTTNFLPAGPGSTVLSAVQPDGFAVPNQYRTVTASVNTPSIGVTDGVTIGRNLQIPANFTLGQLAPAGGLAVTLTSNSQSLLLSATQNGAGSASIVIPVTAGAFTGSYYLQAFGASGTATYTATAPGYLSRTGAVTMTPSGVVLGDTFGNIGTTAVGNSPVPIVVYMGQLGSTGAFQQIQQLAANASPVSVPLTASVGTVVSPVSIAPGSENAMTQVTAPSGNLTVTATNPAGYTPSDKLTLKVFVF
jgi:hypothetical protein